MIYFSKSAVGYSHLKAKKPCQDFSACYHDEERTIVTACDGHGGDIYVRSQLGSKFASEAIMSVFKQVNRYALGGANRSDIEKKLRLEILCEWNSLVERSLAQKPLQKKEVAFLNEDAQFRLKSDPQIAYGTTLNGAMIVGNKVVCASLGDGGCLLFHKGKVTPAFDDDNDEENVANITYSMCQSDAFNHLHVKIFDLATVDGVMVFTDGLINPYRNLENFVESFVCLAITTAARGNSSDLEKFVSEVGSKLGTGDDVSVGMILGSDIRVKYYGSN